MSAPAAPPRSSGLLKAVLIALATLGGLALLLLVALVGAAVYFRSIVPPGQIPAEIGGLAVGQPAPALTAPAWINGEPGDLSGKVTVVEGFFYDCPHCWTQAPHVAELHEQYATRGVAFVGLTFDPTEDAERVQDFVTKNGLPFPVGYGAAETLDRFQAQFYPAMWVIGKDGRVVWNRAMMNEQSLDEAVAAALAAS